MGNYPGSACACVSTRAHARVCVRMCVVLCVYVCSRVCGAGAHVCRAAGAGAAAGAGVGTGAGPPPLITVHPPTELCFRQSRATPEPQN